LVLRGELSGNPTVKELVGRIRDVALDAYAHQDLPFERLVEELRPERTTSHTPFFQVMFILLNRSLGSLELQGLKLSPLNIERAVSKYDLTLSLAKTDQGLVATIEYNTDLFNESTITRFEGHYSRLLQSIAADVERRISGLGMLTGEEVEQL